MGDTEDAAAVYDRVSARAASLGVAIAPEELAELAVRHSMGGGELAALDAVFSYLADKRHDQVMLPPMYFPPFTPMIHNRSRQPAPAGYANVFPPLSAPPPNLSRNARASRARALSEPG